MKKLTAVLLVLAMVLSLAACQPKVAPSSTAVLAAEQTADQSTPVLTSKNFSLTLGELMYFFAMNYNQYMSYLNYIGVDLTRYLKDQYYSDELTWFDVFLNQARYSGEMYLQLLEEAKARGITMSQEDKDYIAKVKKDIKNDAASYGWSEELYISQSMGTNIEPKYIYSVLEKIVLADHAYNEVVAARNITDADIRAEYDRDPAHYSAADFHYISLRNTETSVLSLEQYNQVKDSFAAAAESGSQEAYIKAAHDYYKLYAEASEKELEGTPDEYAADQYEKDTYTQISYAEENEASKWIFANDRQVGDIYFKVSEEENVNQFTVALITKAPYRDTTHSVSVRHILFANDSYADAAAAKAKAQEIYNKWVQDGAKEEDFITLCATYSADGNASSGGLYEGVTTGQMVEPFENWIMDPSRKTGDHGLVETEYGTHMMYFVEDLGEVWKISVKNTLEDQYMNAFYDRMDEEYPITVNEELMRTIKW